MDRRGGLKLGEIAQALGVELEGDPELRVAGVAPLETARPDQISFVTHPSYAKLARTTQAGALLVFRDAKLPGPLLRADDPRVALIGLLRLFHPEPTPPGGIHPSAQVAASARLHPSATVGAMAVIEAGAVVGERTWIFPLVYVGEGAEIGADCVVYPHVVVRDHVKVGNRVIIHPGAVLGADGFGYVFDRRGHRKIPQVGTVRIEDDVEIGANTSIDRATVGETVIRRGAKIDNLVQVAHNVEIGENALLAGQVGIAGSSRVGARAMLGGQVGIADHLTVADDVMLAAQSGVISDLLEPGPYLGTPARPAPESRRIWVALPRLPELLRKVRELERRVRELEGRPGVTPAAPEKPTDE